MMKENVFLRSGSMKTWKASGVNSSGAIAKKDQNLIMELLTLVDFQNNITYNTGANTPIQWN